MPRIRAHWQTRAYTDVKSPSPPSDRARRGTPRCAPPLGPDLHFASPQTSTLGVALATDLPWCTRATGRSLAIGRRAVEDADLAVGLASATPSPTARVRHGRHLHHPGAGCAHGGAHVPQSKSCAAHSAALAGEKKNGARGSGSSCSARALASLLGSHRSCERRDATRMPVSCSL
jgi:hypothetical protein